MDAVVIEVKHKKDVKFWLDLAKKFGTRAKSVNVQEVEDAYMAVLIEKGMESEEVSREKVMKAL